MSSPGANCPVSTLSGNVDITVYPDMLTLCDCTVVAALVLSVYALYNSNIGQDARYANCPKGTC